MAKIKVGELREVIKQNKHNDIITVDYHGLQIEIKQFTNVQEKINLVASMFESAINRENGLHLLNYNNLDVAYKIFVVQEYTNISLPKNTTEAYDLLISSGLYDFIYDNIPLEERTRLETALDNHIEAMRDEYEQKNTIQYIIKDGLNKLIEKVPDEEGMKEFIKNASNELNNMNPENLKFVQEFLRFNKGE